MIPCRRSPVGGGLAVAAKPSAWAPTRNLLASGIIAAGLLLSIALTSRAPLGLSLDLLPASPAASSVRHTLEQQQQQRQRYERQGLHAPTRLAADEVRAEREVTATAEQRQEREQQQQAQVQRSGAGEGSRKAGQPGGEAPQQQDDQHAQPQQIAVQQRQGSGQPAQQQHEGKQQAQQQPQLQAEQQPAEQAAEQAQAEQQPLQRAQQAQAEQVQAEQQPAEQILEALQPQAGQAQAEQVQDGQQLAALPEGGPSPYQQAVAACHDLACLTEAAKQPRAPGQFLFPHFFVIGWQKCATTSLFFHLRDRHPQVAASLSKEPEFFTDACAFQPHACPALAQQQYIHDTLRHGEIEQGGMAQAGGEASTHYGRNGHLLAQGVRQVFPWLKIVASMREPISRSISMLAHNLDKHSKGCLAKRRAYSCLVKSLSQSNYSEPFQAWLDAFPAPQVLLVQYENLTSDTHGKEVLRHVKTFLDLDPALPIGEDSIGHNNSRVARMERMGELAPGEQPQGWPMKQWQYEKLVELVRPDAERMADIAERHGFADRAGWLANWEAEWQATLNDCHKGWCDVYPN